MDNDLIVQVNLDSPVPAYRQIVDAIRAFMVEGRLRPGDGLPTVRELAADLALHHNTVAQAYRELAEEGWLELRRRRGAMVVARKEPAASPGVRREFERRLRELVAKASADGLSTAEISEALQSVAQPLKGGRPQ